MAQTDDRVQRMVQIQGAGQRPSLFVGPQSGGRESRLNVMVRDLSAKAGRFRQVAAEIRAHPSLLPSERGIKLAEAAGPLTATLKEAHDTFAAESARIAKTAHTATAVPAYGDIVPYHVVQADRDLISKLAAMEPKDRAVHLHRMATEPTKYARWNQAVLRQPKELAGVSDEEHDGIRTATLRAFDPALANAIDSELEQSQQAKQTLQHVWQVLAEDAPGITTELQVTSPELAAVVRA